jgi:putative cell wall-binding protein
MVDTMERRYATINDGSRTILTTGDDYVSYRNTSNLILNNNTTNMNQQVKVAVFRVERSKHNEIKSSTFITEMWIENKPGVSIDFAVAKKLDNKYDADEIVIKQIFTVTL